MTSMTTAVPCAHVFPDGRGCTVTGRHAMHAVPETVHQLPDGAHIGDKPCTVPLTAYTAAFDGDPDRAATTVVLLDLGSQTIELRTQADAENAATVLLDLAATVRRLGAQLAGPQGGRS